MGQKRKVTGRTDFVKNVWRKIAVMIFCAAAMWPSFFGKIIMAQEQGEWSSPYLLADSKGLPSEALMVSDTYGFLHIFWIEKAVDDEVALIQYVRFDGTEFTTPLDIYATRTPVGGSGVSYIAPYIDQDNQIHLFWTEGNRGPAYYSTAPAHNTLSAHNWSEPVEIALPIFQLRPVVDSQNRLHLLYSDFWGPKPGVFHTFSEDGGKTWSEPTWLDPDIPTGQAPKTIHLAIDDRDGLHAVWAYLLLENAIGQSVRYARTLPDGEWALPIEIDEPDESESELRLSEPNIIAQGNNIHIVWAGTENTNREYRFSTDYGQNWSVPIRIFGDLGGQAIGDGLALDGLNRVHFMGQIRYPQAIHHAIWEDGFWSNTDPIYLINPDYENDMGGIHAHWVRLGIRQGNELVVTFTDEANGGPLYVMHRTLDDLPSLQITPTPVIKATPTKAKPTPTLIASSTVTPTSSQVQKLPEAIADSPTEPQPPIRAVLLSLIPVLFLLGITTIYKMSQSR